MDIIKKILKGATPPSKLSALVEAERIKKKIVSGKISPLPYFVAKNYLEEFFFHLLDEEVKDMAVDEIGSYGKEGFQFNGASVKYHYRHTYNYHTTKRLCEIEKEIARLQKKRKKLDAVHVGKRNETICGRSGI